MNQLIGTSLGTIFNSIAATMLIIGLGFILGKINFLGPDAKQIISKIVLFVSLPALTFISFMKPMSQALLKGSMVTLVISFLSYVGMILVVPFFYKKSTSDSGMLSILTIFAANTFFGLPMINAIYGAEGIAYASIYNIFYRVFLYSYAFIVMSNSEFTKAKIKKTILNPIVLATLLGLVLWTCQNFMPQVMVGHGQTVAFYRIDQTAIWLYQPLEYLSKMATPLSWLAIGLILSQLKVAELKFKPVHGQFLFNKMILVPLLILLLTLGVAAILPGVIDPLIIKVVIILTATPPASVAVLYAIQYQRQPKLASELSLLATICAMVSLPLWILILGFI